MIIGKRFKFDAAHFLPNYPGNCREMHGHTWHMVVQIQGEPSKLSGMVLDFKDLTTIVKGFIDPLDHQCLNNLIENPTCERLVQYLWYKLANVFGERLKSITIQEGEGGWATYES